MKRIQLFEFTDLSWYPRLFRRMQTDYLQFVSSLGAGHKNLIPLFARAMQHAGTSNIVDLCSGGAGPWVHLQEQLDQVGLPVRVLLTDKYPHPEAVQKLTGPPRQRIEYYPEPVDALNVPPELKGMRTLFEGFHHFRPAQARLILQNAAESKAAIGIFEASLMPPFGLILFLLAPLTTLLSYFFLTPFIKPRTLSRFLWTYLIPIVPLATCWDGIISFLRGYSPTALKELTDSLEPNDFIWEIGQASTGTPVFVFTYLVGYPYGVAETMAGK